MQVANSGLPRPLHLRNGKFEEIPVDRTADRAVLQRRRTRRVICAASPATSSSSSATASPTPPVPRATCSAAAAWRKSSLKHADRSADEIAQAIFSAVSEHAKGVEAFDDQTIVVLKVKGTPAKK